MIENQAEEHRGNGESREGQGTEELRELADELDSRLRTFVRERPFATVAAAVAAGFVLGRLLRG